jgi:hypothetical protein
VKEQLTPAGIAVLVGAMLLFWLAVGVLVRRHARRSPRRKA